MSECTQPELWANRPGANASEEEVARYLDHLDQCAFHAAMENADERLVQGMAAFANSEPAGSETNFNRPAPARGRQVRWTTLLKVAAAAAALVTGALLFSMFFLRTRSGPEEIAVPTASPSPSPSPASEVITNSNARPAPSAAPNVNGDRPGPTSIATVKRIYVGPAEGEYNQHLRKALIDEVKVCPVFTLAERREEADAVLEIEGTRGPTVRVQLVDRAGKPLWFTTQPTTEESEAAAKEVATRTIRALSQQVKPPR